MCTADMETTVLLVLILTNNTDEMKTMKKFRPSFMTASHCDFDLIKLGGCAVQHTNSAQILLAAPELSVEDDQLLLPGCELDLTV